MQRILTKNPFYNSNILSTLLYGSDICHQTYNQVKKCLRKILEQFCNHSKVKKKATMSYSERNLQMSDKMAWPSSKASTCLASIPTTTLQISNGKLAMNHSRILWMN